MLPGFLRTHSDNHGKRHAPFSDKILHCVQMLLISMDRP